IFEQEKQHFFEEFNNLITLLKQSENIQDIKTSLQKLLTSRFYILCKNDESLKAIHFVHMLSHTLYAGANIGQLHAKYKKKIQEKNGIIE
ncbi:hypothetical protein DF186_16430, partial [Enterococcus hirae]